jgi:hypothetical protein
LLISVLKVGTVLNLISSFNVLLDTFVLKRALLLKSAWFEDLTVLTVRFNLWLVLWVSTVLILLRKSHVPSLISAKKAILLPPDAHGFNDVRQDLQLRLASSD